MNLEREFLTTAALAQAASVSQQQVRHYVRRGWLSPVNPTAKREHQYFRHADIERVIVLRGPLEKRFIPPGHLSFVDLAKAAGVARATLQRYVNRTWIVPVNPDAAPRQRYYAEADIEHVKALRNTPEPREGVGGLMTLRQMADACGVSYDALKSRAARGKMQPCTPSGKGLDVFYDPRDVPEMAQVLGGIE